MMRIASGSRVCRRAMAWIRDVPGVKVVESCPDEVILEVGSGEYRVVGR